MMTATRRPAAWAASRCALSASTKALTLPLAEPGIGILSSSHKVSRNSGTVTRGFRTKAMSTPEGSRASSERTKVVLPVPTSPVSWMKPPASLTP